MVAGERAAAILTELHARLESCFARPEPYVQARKYMAALMSDLPRKNGWTVAEHAGDATPDRTQRLLNHAVWDNERAAGVVRGFVVEHLAPGAELMVGALDESGHQKQGSATAGGGETAVHGLRRAGRERGQHRVLHVCHAWRALLGRRAHLGARRAARGPGPPCGARYP